MPDNDQLELKYIPLGTISKWTDNYKKHDIGTLVRSIRKHGFRDPLSFDKNLNKGKGGFVEGNGRDDALAAMFRQDPKKPPRGISILKGEWLIPVLFGLDAESQGMAEAYGIDHNNITLLGGDFELADLMRQWDKGHEQQLVELAELDELPVSIDADLLDVLLSGPEFTEYDEDIADGIGICSCPNCGNEHSKKN